MGLITLPNNFEKILDKTEKKVEIDDNNNSSTEDGGRVGLEVSKSFLLLHCCQFPGDLRWTLENRDFESKGSSKSTPAWTVILHHTSFIFRTATQNQYTY